MITHVITWTNKRIKSLTNCFLVIIDFYLPYHLNKKHKNEQINVMWIKIHMAGLWAEHSDNICKRIYVLYHRIQCVLDNVNRIWNRRRKQVYQNMLLIMAMGRTITFIHNIKKWNIKNLRFFWPLLHCKYINFFKNFPWFKHFKLL